jgi:hypothetical protein
MMNKTPEEAVQTKSGRKLVFSPEMENESVDYLLFKERRLFGLTRQDVRSLAFQSSARSDLKNNFSRALKGTAPQVNTGCMVSSTDTKTIFHCVCESKGI